MTLPADPVRLRRTVYLLLITVAVAAVCGRIASVARVYEPYLSRDPDNPNDTRGAWPSNRPEPMPTFGDNDRSRWDTVRALVDDGTYAIGARDRTTVLVSAATPVNAPDALQTVVLAEAGYQARIASDSGIVTQDGWKTIDKVMHPSRLEYYSSKPPLLATLAAGEYWLLHRLFGWSITDQRWEVVRVVLLTFNALPFLIYLLLLARLVERFGATDWGRLYVLAAGCFGTFLTTFATTFNNHTLATCTALFALYPALLIWSDDTSPKRQRGDTNSLVGASGLYAPRQNVGLYLLAGFWAGLTACNELPAAAFAAALLVFLLWRSPLRTLLAYVPGAALPAVAFLLTNRLALGEWKPAYANFGGPWYEFEGSYWKLDPDQVRHGIDWAYQTEGQGVYAFHVLLGHHGLFSLTPAFLLAIAGVAYVLLRRRTGPDEEDLTPRRPGAKEDKQGEGRLEGPQTVPADASSPVPFLAPWRLGVRSSSSGALSVLAGLTLFLAVVVIGFYTVGVGARERNYGGWTSAPRWLMWLTPFLLLSMLPVADWLAGRRWGRGLGYLLLAVSVFSASYPAWNPWRHPWIYNLMESQGWIRY